MIRRPLTSGGREFAPDFGRSLGYMRLHLKDQTLKGTKLLKTIVMLMVAFSTPYASCQALWHGTSLGMSLDQAKKAIPEATMPTQTPDKLESGAIEELHVPPFPLVGVNFEGALYFLNGKLVQVILSAKEFPKFGSMMLFPSMSAALNDKYGPGNIFRTGGMSAIATASGDWFKGRTHISLSAFSSPSLQTLRVKYSDAALAAPNDAEKL